MEETGEEYDIAGRKRSIEHIFIDFEWTRNKVQAGEIEHRVYYCFTLAYGEHKFLSKGLNCQQEAVNELKRIALAKPKTDFVIYAHNMFKADLPGL